jgi:hypothetical protein
MKKARQRQLAAGELARKEMLSSGQLPAAYLSYQPPERLLASWPDKGTFSSGQVPVACLSYQRPL